MSNLSAFKVDIKQDVQIQNVYNIIYRFIQNNILFDFKYPSQQVQFSNNKFIVTVPDDIAMMFIKELPIYFDTMIILKTTNINPQQHRRIFNVDDSMLIK